MSKTVKIGVVGIGIMGKAHIHDIATLGNTELAAVCDVDHATADTSAAEMRVPAYYDYKELLEHENLDAVVISTPHYDHTPISIAALQKGIHVLVEKPIAVHVKDARKMIAAHEAAQQTHPNLVFAAMFMQRTYGHWRKIKSLIDSGELGQLVRTTWLITDWFRTQSYYNNGGWRATWKGEGGGVLLNQSPHNIDLYQWFVGMPKRVTGFAALGKYHRIEVEDEVTAYFEHENGMIGHFITSTAESPGTNRLEIVGDKGKLVYENGKLTVYRNQRSMFEQIQQAAGGFDKVESVEADVPFEPLEGPGHRTVIENFANAILHGETLIAPAAKGINSVMLANAVLMSSFEGRTVNLPLDDAAYEQKLRSLIG
ncbi:MAG: Gfo/Idh/MocA family oxidoreductase [Chloroflexi bacterium]|nr:Gfo/Idh/MocA family oxidoreductase [Chloroflexota bacterium]MCC6894499.1 Gfo/Idh/MocA family oxidoreductase [Anaerolineae bacterium]